MKLTLIAGVALVALGIFILVTGPSWGSQETMMRLGDMQVSADVHRSVPPWVGWVSVVGGAVLVLGSWKTRRRAA